MASTRNPAFWTVCVCQNCSGEFSVLTSQMRRGYGKYCSRKCMFVGHTGPKASNWKGGRCVSTDGYVHLTSGSRALKREHTAVAERALGKPLPYGAEVHHVNGNRADNRPQNLVICQDKAYHRGLHGRLNLLRAGGRPFLDKVCSQCRQAKPLTDFSPSSSRGKPCRSHTCKPCAREAQKKLRESRRAAGKAA